MSVEILPNPSIAAAFESNRLLSTLTVEGRALIEPHLQLIELETGQTVLAAGAHVERTIFPFHGLVVSLLVELSGGRTVEVATIGKEGAVGGIISCGAAPAFTHGVVQIGGPALVMPMHALELAKRASDHVRNLFCRYSDFLLSQVMQSVACNAYHALEQRTARWLLTAQDRVEGDRLPLTQEALAGLLGVQRTTVNAVAKMLQEQGVIAYRRGAIQIRDRDALMKVACECYTAVEGHFANVVGSDGAGQSDTRDCA